MTKMDPLKDRNCPFSFKQKRRDRERKSVTKIEEEGKNIELERTSISGGLRSIPQTSITTNWSQLTARVAALLFVMRAFLYDI